MVSSSKRTK